MFGEIRSSYIERLDVFEDKLASKRNAVSFCVMVPKRRMAAHLGQSFVTFMLRFYEFHGARLDARSI